MTAQPEMQPQIQCCGIWTDYPEPGRDTQCPVCKSTFTVSASPAESPNYRVETACGHHSYRPYPVQRGAGFICDVCNKMTTVTGPAGAPVVTSCDCPVSAEQV